MIKKLRLKFIVINMSIVVIMLSVIFGLIFHFTRAGLENESVHMMQAIASQPFSLGVPGTLYTENQDIRLPYFMLHVGPNGELLATNGGYYDLSDDAFLGEMAALALSSPKEYGVISQYNLRYYRQELPGNHCLVFADISSEISTLNHMTRTCIAIGILSFFAFLEISILLSKWAVRPVEQAWQQQRQFVADASHELKTPLTVILTNAELAGNEEYSESEKLQFIQNIRTVSGHMKVLIEQMLALARADSRTDPVSRLAVPFGASVSNVLMAFEALLYESEHPLSSDIDESITVPGDSEQLAQLPEILLDNAIKYASPKGRIIVTLQKSGHFHCLLAVANEGESISPEELKNLFKRFYRLDAARSRDGSFGLGLSIAESIVTQHNGKIWAESKNGYNYFYILLPVS